MPNGTQITVQSEDLGTVIRGTAYTRTNGVDALIDLNDLSLITLIFRNPDGVVTTQTAIAENGDGGTDGIWIYTTIATDFTINPGIWYVQAKYTYATGDILHSQIKAFNVGEVIA